MTLGEKIKFFRMRKNLTLEELGAKIGATKQTIYKYENDIIDNIPTNKIEALARILGIAPAYLLGWEEICDEDIVQAILEEMHNQSLSFTDLAKETKIFPEILSHYLEKEGNIYKEDFVKICGALGYTTAEFLRKNDLYKENIPDFFDGDIEKYEAFKKAVDEDGLKESAELTEAERTFLDVYNRAKQSDQEAVKDMLKIIEKMLSKEEK